MLPQLFNYEGQQIRTEVRDGMLWFIMKDICDILEIVNNRDAYLKLDQDEKGVVLTDTPGGKQAMQVVNEYGIYALVFASRKPEAKTFKRWITHEVIPSLRKNGAYITHLTTAEGLLQSVQLLAKQERELNEVKQAQAKSQTILVAHEFALSVLDQRVTNEITLTTREQKQIQGAVNSRAYTIGLPDLYRQIYGGLKKYFGIPSYRDLKRSDLTKAFEFIRCWTPRIQ